MKKFYLIIVTVICFNLSSFGQNEVIQTDEANKAEAQDKCAYRIAGICTTEDIGGVEVARIRRTNEKGGHYYNEYFLEFENYNNFTVTVIFEYTTFAKVLSESKMLSAEKWRQDKNIITTVLIEKKRTGTIVLKANEKKITKDIHDDPCDFKLIARKLND